MTSKELVQQPVKSEFPLVAIRQAVFNKKGFHPLRSKVEPNASGRQPEVSVPIRDAKSAAVDEPNWNDTFVEDDVGQARIAVGQYMVFSRRRETFELAEQIRGGAPAPLLVSRQSA